MTNTERLNELPDNIRASAVARLNAVDQLRLGLDNLEDDEDE